MTGELWFSLYYRRCTFVLPARILGSDHHETRQSLDKPPLGSTEGNRPIRLCLRIDPQFARRRADAKATAERLANTVLLENIPSRLFRTVRFDAELATHHPEQSRREGRPRLFELEVEGIGGLDEESRKRASLGCGRKPRHNLGACVVQSFVRAVLNETNFTTKARTSQRLCRWRLSRCSLSAGTLFPVFLIGVPVWLLRPCCFMRLKCYEVSENRRV